MPRNHVNAIAVIAGLLAAGPLRETQGQVFIDTFTSGFQNGGTIPDGNLAGWSDTRTLSGTGTITDVTLHLALSGGFNGDLYGYLSHEGVLVPILNRVGLSSSDPFGYSDAGLNVTFSDGAPLGDIHYYQLVPDFSTRIADGSSWQPDGRTLSPVNSDPSDYDLASRTSLNALAGLAANGAWTLFIADVSTGGGTATVSRWGWQITAVPEPGHGVAAAAALITVGVAYRITRNRCRGPR